MSVIHHWFCIFFPGGYSSICSKFRPLFLEFGYWNLKLERLWFIWFQASLSQSLSCVVERFGFLRIGYLKFQRYSGFEFGEIKNDEYE